MLAFYELASTPDSFPLIWNTSHAIVLDALGFVQSRQCVTFPFSTIAYVSRERPALFYMDSVGCIIKRYIFNNRVFIEGGVNGRVILEVTANHLRAHQWDFRCVASMVILVFQKTQKRVKVFVVNSILVDSQHSIILSKRLSGIPQTVINTPQIFLRVPNILLNQQRVPF